VTVSSGGGTTHTTQVSPHRRNPDKPEAFADRTLLALRDGGLLVRDARNHEYRYPLAASAHRDPDAVAALVIARIQTGDRAGDGITERIELMTADKRTVCWIPALGWSKEELESFSKVAGLRYAVDEIGNFGELRRAYPMVKGAPGLPLYTRKGVAVGAVALLVIIVVIGAILLALAL
jgi:hypothetical protein